MTKARLKAPLASSRAEPTAAAILIGSELLSGKIADLNLAVLARHLRALGVKLVRATTIPDELRTITREVREAARRHTWVFTSGGVGPTHDDVTIDGVAKALGRDVVRSAKLERLIRGAYGERLRDGHLLMARIPRGARLVASAEVPWPTVLLENVWVLPGVPEIFAMKMTLVESVVGRHAPFHSIAVLVTLDEGTFKPKLDVVVAAFPDVDIGSYPRWTDPVARTRLTFDARDRARCEAARSAFVSELSPEEIVGLEG